MTGMQASLERLLGKEVDLLDLANAALKAAD